jgi:hypothetical protein
MQRLAQGDSAYAETAGKIGLRRELRTRSEDFFVNELTEMVSNGHWEGMIPTNQRSNAFLWRSGRQRISLFLVRCLLSDNRHYASVKALSRASRVG